MSVGGKDFREAVCESFFAGGIPFPGDHSQRGQTVNVSLLIAFSSSVFGFHPQLVHSISGQDSSEPLSFREGNINRGTRETVPNAAVDRDSSSPLLLHPPRAATVVSAAPYDTDKP